MTRHLLNIDQRYERWGLSPEPTGATMAAALFSSPIIEWSRIGAFQAVTMSLIAQRLLPMGSGETYAASAHAELSRAVGSTGSTPMRLIPLPPGMRAHVFASPHNAGAIELIEELKASLGLQQSLHVASSEYERSAEAATSIHFLVYLHQRTWTSGAASAALAAQIEHAMELGVTPLLVHEQPGDGGQAERGGVEFASFFDTTPRPLLDRKLYADVAVPLKGGALRPISLSLLGKALVSEGEEQSQCMSALVRHAPEVVMEAAKGCLRQLGWPFEARGTAERDSYGTELDDLARNSRAETNASRASRVDPEAAPASVVEASGRRSGRMSGREKLLGRTGPASARL